MKKLVLRRGPVLFWISFDHNQLIPEIIDTGNVGSFFKGSYVMNAHELDIDSPIIVGKHRDDKEAVKIGFVHSVELIEKSEP